MMGEKADRGGEVGVVVNVLGREGRWARTMGIRLFRALTLTEALVRVDRVGAGAGVGPLSSSSSSARFSASASVAAAAAIMLTAILASEAEFGFPSILILILPVDE